MDDEFRALQHKLLDRLLDRRSELEVPGEHDLNALLGAIGQRSPTLRAGGQAEARQLFKHIIMFASEIAGPAIQGAGLNRTYVHDIDQRELLIGWLNTLLPLVQGPPTSILGQLPARELTVFNVLDGLSALGAGEIHPLFRANKGKNRRANHWSLTRTKLDALVWKSRLRALGHHEKSANFEVMNAFGEQWDTIRRWKSQCERILGSDFVGWSLEYAGSPRDIYMQPVTAGMFGGRPDPADGLRRAGAAYLAERARSAELSKRKMRAVS